jgi:hypothetical protein
MRYAAPRGLRASSLPLLAGLIVLAASPLHAATFLVTDQTTLVNAITAAENNKDPDNFIYVTVTPLYTNGPIQIVPDINTGNRFDDTHRLMFRSMVTTSPRAEIIDQAPGGEVLTLNSQAGVTIQNLDFLRDITTLSGLMSMTQCTDVTFERCRLGYVNMSIGNPGLRMLDIWYPTHVVIRNCDFFSVIPGAFDEAIHVEAMNDKSNSLFLYNNDVSGYGKIGIRSDGAGPFASLILLRNNVAENSPAIAPEPVAYSSGAVPPIRVLTSHNSAFAAAANAEVLDAGAQSIAGVSQPDFLLLSPTVLVETGSFITQTWDATPGAVNATFDHLIASGNLHDPLRPGVTVLDGAPDANDVAVVDDFDHEPRPSVGTDPHTDRGLDQVDAGNSAASVGKLATASGLWAAPLRNPSATLDLAIGCAEGGSLRVEMYDLGGRVLWSASRDLAGGAALTLRGPGSHAAGVVFYRVRLIARSGATHEASGRMVLVH